MGQSFSGESKSGLRLGRREQLVELRCGRLALPVEEVSVVVRHVRGGVPDEVSDLFERAASRVHERDVGVATLVEANGAQPPCVVLLTLGGGFDYGVVVVRADRTSA